MIGFQFDSGQSMADKESRISILLISSNQTHNHRIQYKVMFSRKGSDFFSRPAFFWLLMSWNNEWKCSNRTTSKSNEYSETIGMATVSMDWDSRILITFDRLHRRYFASINRFLSASYREIPNKKQFVIQCIVDGNAWNYIYEVVWNVKRWRIIRRIYTYEFFNTRSTKNPF